MDEMECQHHANCGGWCETEEEKEAGLCCFCLSDCRDEEEQLARVAEVERAIQRIADAAGIEMAQPGEIADQVCARLNESLTPQSGAPATSGTAETHDEFYAGVLAVLSVVYLHDDPTCTLAREIVATMNRHALLDFAERDEYHRLDELRETVACTS